MIPEINSFPEESQIKNVVNGFLFVGAFSFLLGAFHTPDRTWLNVLLLSYYLIGIGLAGLLFVALQYATSAGWSVSIRRIPETMAMVIPFGAIGIFLVFLFHPSFYPWGQHLEIGIHHEPTLWFRELWLGRPFFLLRFFTYVSLWILFSALIIKNSRDQDSDGLMLHSDRNKAFSSIFLVVFGLTLSLASFDWIMTLDRGWFSTIFGVYHFSGLFQSGLAIIVIFVVMLRENGTLKNLVTSEHLHALGKLLFGFCSFWMYIWLCQYLLIWYVNNPEETGYFVTRLHGNWKSLFFLNILLNWLIPFLVLLPKPSKRSETVMFRVALVVLVGRWLDLYLMIFPPILGRQPAFGFWEAGMAVGTIGLFLGIFFHFFKSAKFAPIKDPLLEESILHHQ